MVRLRRPESVVGQVLREPASTRPATVVVVGAFRGGTSFIGERLDRLGVPMGRPFLEVLPNPDYVSYEDPEVGRAIDGRDWARLGELVAERDAEHEVWGFKKPSSSFQIDRVLPLLRNPLLVVVTRDPLAAHQSGLLHGTVKPGDLSLDTCRAHHLSVLDAVLRPRGPTLAFSFERAKDDVAGVDEALRSFLGISGDARRYDSRVAGAADEVAPADRTVP